MPGLAPAQRAAVGEYEAAIGELRRLDAELLAAAEQLKPVTIEAPARQIRLGGRHRGPAPRLARDGLRGLTRNGTAMGVKDLMITVLPPLAVRMWVAVRQRVS